MTQVRLNGNILEHLRSWRITTIDSNGAIQYTEKRKLIKSTRMQKTTWVLCNRINAENVVQCERSVLITVENVNNAFIEWIIIVLGPIIVWDI